MQITFHKYLKVRVCLELGRPCMRAHVSTLRRRCASCCTDRGGLDDALQFSLLIGRELASPSASYYFFAALDCFIRIVTSFEGKRLKYFVCFCEMELAAYLSACVSDARSRLRSKKSCRMSIEDNNNWIYNEDIDIIDVIQVRDTQS